MAKSADLHIRIDPETKANAENLFSLFGITVTDAVNMFLRQSVLVGGLPFELKQPRFNSETEAAIHEARDIRAGKVQAKIYHSVAEMNADIDADLEER
ncbi:MAG: type II toxin-antitoxin system RelB/DinJ family antitoxin [Clostridium sp.]|nr:type II toxin-antitoxin system RelB/DinJ family antitoxin [Clostridium sp.]